MKKRCTAESKNVDAGSQQLVSAVALATCLLLQDLKISEQRVMQEHVQTGHANVVYRKSDMNPASIQHSQRLDASRQPASMWDGLASGTKLHGYWQPDEAY